MASYGHSVQADHVRSTIAEAKSLTVERLKRVLRGENLQVSGIKSELQIRLIAHIEKCAASGDLDRVSRIRSTIRGVTGSYPNPYPSPYSTSTPTTSLSPQFASPTPRPPPPMPSYPMPSYIPNRLTFKSSPFFTITRPLAPVQELKAREQTRDTARLTVLLDAQTVDLLQRDNNVRVMVFCASESIDSRHLPSEISFPQHGELKCNSDDVKANLKGLKNKPGTTRPADITSFIRKKANFPNSVELVYALTTKKYFLVVNLVQKKPIESLITELRHGKYISKESVIKEMRTKASDSDIVAVSSVMSLKDPVQMTRIQTPCRSIACKHYECFDAAAYLSLQEQAPTWSCPFCNRSAPWDNLVFDRYFDDILGNVSSNTDQVTVDPDGSWHVGETETSKQDSKYDRDSDSDADDDDDLIEIQDPRSSATKDLMRTPSFHATPPLPGVSPAPATSSSSNKRKHTETIDLTLDSDEDQQPGPPPPKRSNTSLSSDFMNQSSRVPNYESSVGSSFRFHMPPPPANSTAYNPNRYFTG